MFASFSLVLMNCREKRVGEEIGAVALKNHCALSKNSVFWLRKGSSFFTFFLKTEGLVSTKFLKT